MPISLSKLAEAAARPQVELAKSLTEARKAELRTAFLCHSHRDATYAQGIANLLLQAGFQAYIDWQDTNLPSIPNEGTANKIKRRIRQADLFLFLATPESTKSRWCPWEIGFADGVKRNEEIMVIQTQSLDGTNYGNEYLDLYGSIDVSTTGRLGLWEPSKLDNGIPVGQL